MIKAVFWPVLERNWNLVIFHEHVEPYEAMRIVKVCEDLIDGRQRVMILPCLLIEVPIVHTHPESSFFLWN